MNWTTTTTGYTATTDHGVYVATRRNGRFNLDVNGITLLERKSLRECKELSDTINCRRAEHEANTYGNANGDNAVAEDIAWQHAEDRADELIAEYNAESTAEEDDTPADPIAPPTPAPALSGAPSTLQEAMAETLERVTSKPNGVILYRGPSLIDGSPIVVIATGLANKSSNEKTGDMIQTWILADGDLEPHEAIKVGADVGICGDCIHRGGTCYVNPVQAPLQVYRSLHRGIYPVFNPSAHLALFTGRHLRLGSYGDPAAVPLSVWSPLVSAAAGHTGYTHQWRTCDSSYAEILMASVETIDQRFNAIMRGYRTFRVKLESQPRDEGEFTCPASVEAFTRLSCQECGACHGATSSSRGASPVINFHHSTFGNRYRFKQYEALMRRILADEQTTRRIALPMS